MSSKKHFLTLSVSLLLTLVSCDSTNDKSSSINSKTAEANIFKNRTISDSARKALKHKEKLQIVTNLDNSLSQFIPEGYILLDSAAGDLNLDEYKDLILVIKKPGEENRSDIIDHPEKRPLLILLGNSDKSFKLAARNDNTVYCVDCGGVMGDPFMGVVIKNGYFSVEHYGGSAWRWTRTVTFKYSKADNNWLLHKDGGDNFHATEPDQVTTKVKTSKDFGRVPFEKFDIYKEE